MCTFMVVLRGVTMIHILITNLATVVNIVLFVYLTRKGKMDSEGLNSMVVTPRAKITWFQK